MFRPFDQRDPVGTERLIEGQLGEFLLGVLDPIEVDVLDRRLTLVPLPKDERRAADLGVRAVQCADQRAYERRLSRTERPGEGDDVAGHELGGESACVCIQRGHAVEDVFLGFQNTNKVLLRMSDVLVGICAGAVCSVFAAAFEASILTLRFFTLGKVGGGLGSKLLLIAIVGAILGGLVGFLVGALFKQREPVPRPPAARPPAPR
jgi:hypothetical protein